jgi:hypothetical protein
MPLDSSPIILKSKKPDSISVMLLDIISLIQYKFLGLMFVMFILINSDVFINRILSTFKGAVNYKLATNWGTVLQGLMLVLIMIIIDALIRQNII